MHSLNWMGQLLAWIAALTSSRFRYAWRRKGNSHIVRGSKPTVGNGTKYKHPVTAACSRHAATSGSRNKTAPPGGASSETSSCGAFAALQPLASGRRPPAVPPRLPKASTLNDAPKQHNRHVRSRRISRIPRQWRAPAETAARARTFGRRTWTPWAPCWPSRC